jgi:hypothetical protein
MTEKTPLMCPHPMRIEHCWHTVGHSTLEARTEVHYACCWCGATRIEVHGPHFKGRE